MYECMSYDHGTSETTLLTGVNDECRRARRAVKSKE